MDFFIRESRPVAASKEFYTYGDYLAWPEEERWELIDGIPYNMTPAPSRVHQACSRELITQFNLYLTGKTCKVYAAPFDVRLPKGNEEDAAIDTVVQPDLVIVCDPDKLDERGCKGAPDLVVEILSAYTATKDMKVKRQLYERIGVKEYWLVDPGNKVVQIYKQDDYGKYGQPEIYGEQDQVKTTLFPDLVIDLTMVFAE